MNENTRSTKSDLRRAQRAREARRQGPSSPSPKSAGGYARADSMTKIERSESARKAALARWERKRTSVAKLRSAATTCKLKRGDDVRIAVAVDSRDQLLWSIDVWQVVEGPNPHGMIRATDSINIRWFPRAYLKKEIPLPVEIFDDGTPVP